MGKWFRKNREIVLKSIYSIPICFAIVISVFHCIAWFNIANPSPFAIAMSIGLEVAAATTLIALMTGKITFSIILTFIVVTIYQMLGNIFFSFNFIDENGELFQTWVQFMTIILGETNTWTTELHKFWLSVISGIIVPGLSLLSLHLIATFEFKEDNPPPKQKVPIEETETEIEEVVVEETPVEVIEDDIVQPIVEVKKGTPVIEYPIAVEEPKIEEVVVEETPVEVIEGAPVIIDEEIIIPPVTPIIIPPVKKVVKETKPVKEPKVVKDSKKETTKKNVLGDPKIKIEKSTKPAIIEQPVTEGKSIRKMGLPGFKDYGTKKVT